MATRQSHRRGHSSAEIREILREELRQAVKDHLPPEPPAILRKTKVTLIELIEIVGLLTVLALGSVIGWSKILAAIH